jgi:hypothetical protein
MGRTPLGTRPRGGLGSGPHRLCFAGGRGPPNAELCVGDPEPFPNARHRVWGPFPAEGVSCAASPSGFRPPPLVPGLFSFRARVILLADGPTRVTRRPPPPEQAPTLPHPEPPLLLAFSDPHVLGNWASGNHPANDHVCATIQKVKHPAGEKFFIRLATRSCAAGPRRARTEFRHDSCNTAPG